MVDIYHEVGYKAIAMEWNNAYSKHPNWKKSYAYQPVMVQGDSVSLPMLWTDSIIFQYFQRVVHAEKNIKEYLDNITHIINAGYSNIPIYCSDIEVFNYRPGRFETEAVIVQDEWQIIHDVMMKLSKLGMFKLPGEILNNRLNKNN